jgi:hypothetical protein
VGATDHNESLTDEELACKLQAVEDNKAALLWSTRAQSASSTSSASKAVSSGLSVQVRAVTMRCELSTRAQDMIRLLKVLDDDRLISKRIRQQYTHRVRDE